MAMSALMKHVSAGREPLFFAGQPDQVDDCRAALVVQPPHRLASGQRHLARVLGDLDRGGPLPVVALDPDELVDAVERS